MKDLKYLMSYSIAFMAFLGISIGGFYNYLAVIYTFVFIPVLEVLVKRSDEKYTEQEKANRLLDPFFDILLYLNISTSQKVQMCCVLRLRNTYSVFGRTQAWLGSMEEPSNQRSLRCAGFIQHPASSIERWR